MHDELAARQRAISLRLAGRPIKAICAAVGRSEVWFHRWWGRYLQAGPDGLYDLTRANHHVAQHIPPELERTILSIRRRPQPHATPATPYPAYRLEKGQRSTAGASTALQRGQRTSPQSGLREEPVAVGKRDQRSIAPNGIDATAPPALLFALGAEPQTRLSQMARSFRHGVCAFSLGTPAFRPLPAETAEEPNG
jgi:hypothetical protein